MKFTNVIHVHTLSLIYIKTFNCVITYDNNFKKFKEISFIYNANFKSLI